MQEMQMGEEQINGFSGDERLTSRVNWNEGYNSEFWVSEVEVSTSMDNVTLTEKYVTGRRLDSGGVEILFDSERLFLKFDYDSFQKSLQGNSVQDRLTDILLGRGIIVKHWYNFEMPRIAFNQKVELDSEKLLYLKENLAFLHSNYLIRKDKNENFYFENDGYRLEINFLKIHRDKFVHVKCMLLDDHLNLVALHDESEFYDIKPKDIVYAIDYYLQPIINQFKIVNIDADWFRILESIATLQSRKSLGSLYQEFMYSANLTPGFDEISIDRLYEEYLGSPLDVALKSTHSFLEEMESVRDNLYLTVKFLKGKDSIVEQLKSKFKISRV
ncbi:hypothetical protein LEP1GSC175_1918 [Leptospira santarosai str. HAI821]|uniref:hypothetical protein n=1 Tax=Leptospira santarosai TaxID=28183 RepID=UPI0002BDFC39|nr:hypothetical protein [Leptospira santarosai]EMO33236.1 hypothetical protein LEP1GSC175_1918 [Leptospira santarosai str. HAI821]